MKEAALGILRREDGRILCVFNRRFQTFGLPGGKIEESDEEPFNACCRELFEETGWVAYGWRQCTVEEGPVGDVERVYIYELEACMQTMEGNSEDTSFAWLKPDELIAVSKFGERLRKVFVQLGILYG